MKVGPILALIAAAFLSWHSLKLLGFRSGKKKTAEVNSPEVDTQTNEQNPYAPPKT